jgi:nucleotide-binding universal stress UspA family protein
MTHKKKTILVPWDFTDKAQFALEHAVLVARTTGNDITLLHIIKSESELDEATRKLGSVADEAHKKYQVVIQGVVREGSIFTTIGEVSHELDADVVIMGTHGMRGMQKLLGSWALKVIVSSRVPFIVVQAPPINERYHKVVFPMDFKIENREKFILVHYLSKHFNSKVYVLRKKNNDDKFKRQTENNVVLARNYFEDKKVNYEITTAEGKDDFATETIAYAKGIGADMIVIMATKNISLADYMLAAPEQQIIANEENIPVMCVTPRPAKLGFFRASGGA